MLSKRKVNEDEILDALPFLEDVEHAGIQELQRFGIYSLIPKNQFKGIVVNFFLLFYPERVKCTKQLKMVEKSLCIV